MRISGEGPRQYFSRVIEDALGRGVPWLAPLAYVYSASISVEREIRASDRTRVVAIGGATLGGSGKTPLSLSCAKYMHSKGARVAIVGHAYRARPRAPQFVTADSPLDEVGDEARMLARALADDDRAHVVVAPTRAGAVAFAERAADVIVLDGVLQTAPRRATLSLLAVDRDAPWGAGLTLPAGDLRASQKALVAACDRIVSVEIRPKIAGTSSEFAPKLAGTSVGLVTAIARPERVKKSLTEAGATVACHVAFGDHGPVRARDLRLLAKNMQNTRVDFWLTTPKCLEHLMPLELGGARLYALEGEATLDDATRAALDHVCAHCLP